MSRIFELLLLAALVSLGACFDAPKVFQGKVVEYNVSTQVLLVKDERPPQQELKFSLKGADIGAIPAAGDLVRLAYLEKNGEFVATRVADFSRQAEIGGKAAKEKKSH